jgi:hypothetical protein
MWLGAAVGRSAISKQAPVTLIAECALLRRKRTAELASEQKTAAARQICTARAFMR